jgi:signal transduction histidine kinase
VAIVYDRPKVRIRVTDDGQAQAAGTRRAGGGQRGHGIDGMRERAALHGGTLRAGPNPDTPEGWLVEATLRSLGRAG